MERTLGLTRSGILSIPVPKTTESYTAIPNAMILDILEKELDVYGYKVEKEYYRPGKKGNVVVGEMTIKGDDPDMGMMFAFQNSYDKSKKLAIAVGGHVFVCENGMITGDAITMKRLHTGEVDKHLQEAIRAGISTMDFRYQESKINRERMGNVILDRKTIAELTGRMFMEEALITNHQLGIIKKEYESPTHLYDNDNNLSLWGFYNTVTYAFKEKSPAGNWMNDHINLHSFVEGEFLKPKGLVVVPEQLEIAI